MQIDNVNELKVAKKAMIQFNEEIQKLKKKKRRSHEEKVQLKFFPHFLAMLKTAEDEFVAANFKVQEIESAENK